MVASLAVAAPTEPSFQDGILTVETLNESILQKLFQDEICILRVPNYCSPEALISLQKFSQTAREHLIKSYYVGYKNQKPTKTFYGIHLWGTPYNSTYHHGPDHESFQAYYQAAVPHMQALRKAVAPHLSPMDYLRLQLDEHWPAGARIATFPSTNNKTKNMFVGICRFMYAEDAFLGQVQPHFDSLPRHVQDLEKQYSANIYMDIPDEGGELEIWDVPPLTATDIVQSDVEKDWRSTLSEPIVIKPEPGELILFNTRRPHAVRGFKSGIRSSIQCFIGIYRDGSLEFWS
jgi:hypothetical protein